MVFRVETAKVFFAFVVWTAAAHGALTGVEPGLEDAVRWKWRAMPSDEKTWGLEIPEPPPPEPVAPSAPSAPAPANSYEVRRGDALILIAKKAGRTVAQLKAANGLKDDMIRIGQVLQIPTLSECIALGLPPEIATVPKRSAARGAPLPDLDQEILLLQVFLDHANFSAGPIDGKNSIALQKLVSLYQASRGGEPAISAARSAVREALVRYTLRAADFRFIAPPKAEKNTAEKKTDRPAEKSGKKKPLPAVKPPAAPVYAEMTSSSLLAYRSPWEFVAERFHCDEALLKSLNPELKPLPQAGAEFLIPNVTPFEIEKALAPPLQPAADPGHVVTAAIVDTSRLEIYSNDRLAAVLPVSPARPGLRGRGTWRILDAIARPCLLTLREPKDPPKPVSSFFTGENPLPPSEVLSAEECLAAGPNNPAGIIWINLAKTEPPEILPFGLHGTSIPGRMGTLAGIGGFRMPNWDIVRAARMLPVGTELTWRQSTAPAAQPGRP